MYPPGDADSHHFIIRNSFIGPLYTLFVCFLLCMNLQAISTSLRFDDFEHIWTLTTSVRSFWKSPEYWFNLVSTLAIAISYWVPIVSFLLTQFIFLHIFVVWLSEPLVGDWSGKYYLREANLLFLDSVNMNRSGRARTRAFEWS